MEIKSKQTLHNLSLWFFVSIRWPYCGILGKLVYVKLHIFQYSFSPVWYSKRLCGQLTAAGEANFHPWVPGKTTSWFKHGKNPRWTKKKVGGFVFMAAIFRAIHTHYILSIFIMMMMVHSVAKLNISSFDIIQWNLNVCSKLLLNHRLVIIYSWKYG